MRIPKKIDTGTYTYKVVMAPEIVKEGGNLDGHVNVNDCIISLSTSRAREMMEETFLHELIHVAVTDSGIQWNDGVTEEDAVRAISPALYRILKNNGLLKGDK